MKSIVCAISIILILTVACEAPLPTVSGECVPVKLVRGICGMAVFKIQDPDFYHFGETVGDEENVFLGTLECPNLRASVDDQTLSEEVFYVELDPDDFAQDCARCYAMINYAGQTNYKVRVHETCISATSENSNR
jgi:hypothetical protein